MASRRINLLPPELAQRKRARAILSSLGAGGLVLILVLGLVYGVQIGRLASERNKLEEQQQRNDALQAQITQLASVERSQRVLQQKTQILAQLTEREVLWSTVLNDISLVIPTEAWLTQFSATVAAGGGEVTEGEEVFGTITLNGMTFSHIDVAKWLTRLSSVEQFTFPYLSLSQKTESGGTPLVTFNSSVRLSEKAFRRNQPGRERKI